MSKVIAIDRHDRRLRYVLAEIGSRARVDVLSADHIDVPADVEDVTHELGQQLRGRLAELKATSARVLVGVGKGELDSIELTVPSAEDSELPLLVRNLAMRNLSSISDETALDFLPGPKRSDGSRDVAAMAVREEVGQELERLLTTAGTSAARIVVRPCELRAFLTAAMLQSQVALIVGSSSQVADVLLQHPEGWQLARSIRLSADLTPATSAAHVVNEIRRTLLTFPVDDFNPTHIDRILLLSGPEELQSLATELGTALDATVQRLNPFSDERVRAPFAPATVSELAPLLGILLCEADGSHPVDFLNPRRPPERVGRRTAILAAAAAAAIVIGGPAYYVRTKLSELDRHNVELVERRNELKELAKEIQPKLRLAAAIQAWEGSRISWLDELRDLTLRMPSSRDLTVQRFSASPSRDGSALVTFSGESRAPEVVTRMEQSLRDEHHAPRTPGIRERPSPEHPIWTFQTTMTIKPRSPKEYTAHLTDETSAAPPERAATKTNGAVDSP